MIDVKDHQLQCQKCGKDFIFTAAEAKSFNEKGLTNLPKKCPACRAADRAKKEQKIRETVECAECGTAFEIPFTVPRGTDGKPLRPLYCVEHFENASPADGGHA